MGMARPYQFNEKPEKTEAERLRDENKELKQRVALLEEDKQRLEEKLRQGVDPTEKIVEKLKWLAKHQPSTAHFCQKVIDEIS